MRVLGDLLDKHLASPKPALVHGSRTVTYQELATEAAQAAAGLEQFHGLPGNRVGLLLRNCPEFVSAYFGAAASGNVVVPINCHLQAGEIAYILNNCQASCLITSTEFLPRIEALRARAPALRHVIVIDAADSGPGIMSSHDFLNQPTDIDVPRRPVLSDDVVVFLYTSGTTGFPKGAMCTHANLLDNVATEAELYGLGADDVFACVLPLFHNYSLVDTCLLPLFHGATVVLADLEDTGELAALIARHRITFLATMPSQLSELVSLPGRPDTSSLRMVQTGGAPLSTEVQRRFQERFGLPIIEGYGCSEASSTVTVIPMVGPYKPQSVGKPMPNQRIRVVDEHDQDVAAGAEGEVVVRGANVFRGYYGLAADSRRTLAGGWLHTGDLGRHDDDGFLYITGRKKSMINVGGFKVYPAEVEEVLTQVDGVGAACVVASRHPQLGETVKAFVEPRGEAWPCEIALRRHCASKLGRYKVPQIFEIRRRLPRTGTGKITARLLQAEELAVAGPDRPAA